MNIITKYMQPQQYQQEMEKNITKMEFEDAEERIRQIVARSYFTSMRLGECSFTQEIYKDDENTMCRPMIGCENTHPSPKGFIQYANEYQFLVTICSFKNMIMNKMFAVEYTDLPKDIKILRSMRKGETSQRISYGQISNNSSMFISTRSGNLNVKVVWDDDETKQFSRKDCSLIDIMRINDISSIKITPKIFSEEFISRQSPKVSTIVKTYNDEFQHFMENFVIPRFIALNIDYTFEYNYYND